MPKLELEDVTLHYEDCGRGPALVFIHGLGSSGLDWNHQIEHFCRDFRVLAPDLRGYGRSSRTAADYTIGAFSRDLAALIERTGCGPAHVVGISLGGAVGFQFAVDRPDLVRSLAIVNSAPDMIFRSLIHHLVFWQRMLAVRWGGLESMGRMLAWRLFPLPTQSDLRENFVRRFAQNSKPVYLKTLLGMRGWSVADRLGEIRCPVLVVTADHDYTPVALKEAYVRKIPRAELAVIEDSRHATPQDQPTRLNCKLRDFLSSVG